MKHIADDLQKIINTIEGLDIKSTYDNMNRLLGCLQLLIKDRDELLAHDAEEKKYAGTDNAA